MNKTSANNPNPLDQPNPFPGLRPFKEDEEHLFFGRENQVDSMVDKLADTHFLAVVGGSGSGKSSLVNCGLIPALRCGLMAQAGTRWRLAHFRPGNQPVRAMARALAEDGVLFSDYESDGLTLPEIVGTSLRMSNLGLIDIFEQAKLDKDVNLLVVADQFEELFRYRRLETGSGTPSPGVSEAATAFVNLLLAVAEQTKYPIYVVLTMRTDFLNECTKFPGLAEAVNDGQYLVPRMTRDERREAISGPVGVGGATISPVLLTRLVNDVGDNPDQLSQLQHALNRTWAYWQSEEEANAPIDLRHYEAVGTMASALDQHAEKAFGELTTPRQQWICERIFKVLTDKANDPRGVRRPKMMGELCAMAMADEAEILDVIDVFRDPSRSFMMPPAGKLIELDTPIDISHESLMRVWNRLNLWADDEAKSAALYLRLTDAANRHKEGSASLWRDLDLKLALDWRDKEKPTEAWAELYKEGFERAMAFLNKSKEVDDSETAESNLVEILRVARNIVLALVAASLLVGPLGLAGSKIRTESFSLTDEFQNSLRSDKCAVVALNKSDIDELRKSSGQIPAQGQRTGRAVKNDVAVSTNGECALKELFAMNVRTPFENNNVRAVLQDYSLLTSQDAISSLESSAPKPSGGDGNSQSAADGTKGEPGGDSSGSPKPSPEADDLKKSLDKLRTSLDSAQVAADEKVYPLLPDSDKMQEGESDKAPSGSPIEPIPETPVNGDPAAVSGQSDEFQLKEVDTEPTPPAEKSILVLPKNITVASRTDDQEWLVSLLLKWGPTRGQLLKKPDATSRILELGSVFTHLVLYFFLLIAIGVIYRKLEFRDPEDFREAAPTLHPWHLRVFKFLQRIGSDLTPGRKRLGKFLLYSLVILSATLLLCLSFNWDRTLLLLAPLALLLFPLGNRPRKAIAVRARIVQGLLLQTIAFLALISAFWLFYTGFYFSFDPSLPIIGNPWFFWNPMTFLIIGSVLFIAGKIKCSVSAEEKLLLNPGTPPVAYFRSYDHSRQDWKEAWAASSIRYFRPKEEQIIRKIFEALGPLVSVGKTDPESSDYIEPVLGERRISGHESRILEEASLVLIQIDKRPTESFLNEIREILQDIDPERLLFYFSFRLDRKGLDEAYSMFADAIQGVVPVPLPPSIESNRFLALSADWTPLVFGSVAVPTIAFGKFLPLLGRRFDIILARRLMSGALRELFVRRNLIDGDKKLYDDFGIGFAAAFHLFGLIPAGYMIFLNLWRMGRRWWAVAAFFAPTILFALIYVILFSITVMPIIGSPTQSASPARILMLGTVLIVGLGGFPIAVYTLWKRFSGKAIRQHIALGGPLQSSWKTLAVSLFPLVAIISIFAILYLMNPMADAEKYQDYVARGVSLAQKGEVDRATLNFEAAKKLQPKEDLLWETYYLDQNPRAVALVWHGVSLAKSGNVREATAEFEKARKLDPKIELDLDAIYKEDSTTADPEKLAQRLAADIQKTNARELAEKGNVPEAENRIKQILELVPDEKFDPETNTSGNGPRAIALVWQGRQLAKSGRWEAARDAFREAQKIDYEIELEPGIGNCDEDREEGCHQDPESIAKELARDFDVREGNRLAQIGLLRNSVVAFNTALQLMPGTDLNPDTIRREESPEAVALVWYGAQSAEQGQLSEAIAAFEYARKYDPQIDLDPDYRFNSFSELERGELKPFEVAIRLAFASKISPR